MVRGERAAMAYPSVSPVRNLTTRVASISGTPPIWASRTMPVFAYAGKKGRRRSPRFPELAATDPSGNTSWRYTSGELKTSSWGGGVTRIGARPAVAARTSARCRTSRSTSARRLCRVCWDTDALSTASMSPTRTMKPAARRVRTYTAGLHGGGGGLAQRVTDAADRLDQAGPSVHLELLPKVGDVHLQRVGRGIVGVAPHLFEDLLAGEHLAGMGEEEGQQLVLEGGEVDPTSGAV